MSHEAQLLLLLLDICWIRALRDRYLIQYCDHAGPEPIMKAAVELAINCGVRFPKRSASLHKRISIDAFFIL